MDCGGSCGPCDLGEGCLSAADCLTRICEQGVCALASCSDGDPNGLETDIDCGGASCDPCSAGKMCEVGADCTSGLCQDGECLPDACANGVKDPGESAIDCGEGCIPCGTGQVCTGHNDCQSGSCKNGTCAAATCQDGLTNGEETGQDCGGGCQSCGLGLGCQTWADCASGACQDGVCVEPSCADGVMNGAETYTDCGGACGACAIPADPALDAPPLDPTVATTLDVSAEHLYVGEGAVVAGVEEDEIDPVRVAVIRGRVRDEGGAPLPGVEVRVQDHPEYGVTLSRAGGIFDLVVNGGGYVNLMYRIEGRPPAQRRVKPRWQDYTWAPDVVMVPIEATFSEVDLSGDVLDFQVAEGVVDDADGRGLRGGVVMFPPGTTATYVDVNGAPQPLLDMDLHITEFTSTPFGALAMPGALPPTSAYTYAVEFTTDQVLDNGQKVSGQDVKFASPVYFYVENFLGFEVGTAVPTGYFDNDRGVWVAIDNGRVIQVITVADGVAQVDVDGNGFGEPAGDPKLEELGITPEELVEIGQRWGEGDALWRVPLNHFSTIDCNWPGGPDPDKQDPPGKQPDPQGNDDKKDPNPEKECGSILECENRVLGERLPLAGSPFSLNYRSSRTPGQRSAYQLHIPVLPEEREEGKELPERVELVVEVAGQQKSYVWEDGEVVDGLAMDYEWDRKDAFGRYVQGKVTATIRIRYTYPATYYNVPSDQQRAFAAYPSDLTFKTDDANFEVIMEQVQYESIGAWDARGHGDLGGWTLDVHHGYDPVGRVVHMGTGEFRQTDGTATNTISTIAGTGASGYGVTPADGATAASEPLWLPEGISTSPNGDVFLVDGRDYILKISQDGKLYIVAGTGSHGTPTVGYEATASKMIQSTTVRQVGEDELYFSQPDAIYKVDALGYIQKVVGGFTSVNGFEVDATGAIFVSDYYANKIWRFTPETGLVVIAGTGTRGCPQGEGEQASASKIGPPEAIAVGADGSIYFGDAKDECDVEKGLQFYRIDTTGRLWIVTPNQPMGWVMGLTVGAEGNVLFSRVSNLFQIYSMTARDGAIPMVGTGSYGYSGDGGPARNARVAGPASLEYGQSGELVFADRNNHVIRRVTPVLPMFDADDILIPSEDGRELYHFDPYGKHLETLDALTGVRLFAFEYDAEGRLIAVVDREGDTTTVTRSDAGVATAVVSPYGVTTHLDIDAAGYLKTVTSPEGERTELSYDTGTFEGLLTHMQKARAEESNSPSEFTWTFTYDSDGYLLSDQDPSGAAQTLTHAEEETGFTVTLKSGEGREREYHLYREPDGDKYRRTIGRDGLISESWDYSNGQRTVKPPDNMDSSTTPGSDPRFGMLAPYEASRTITTAGLPTHTTTTTRSSTLADKDNLLSLTAWSETRTVNGRVWKESFTSSPLRATTTSPVGRSTRTDLDALGRPAAVHVVDGSGNDVLASTHFAYDTRGRLTDLTLADGQDPRVHSTTYDGRGNVASVEDPLGRLQQFEHDLNGRVRTSHLPGDRTLTFTYDAHGNLTSLTPPGGDPHSFVYNNLDLQTAYYPPTMDAELSDPDQVATFYAYNRDRQLTRVDYPDGDSLDYQYTAGDRLTRITSSEGDVVDWDWDVGNAQATGNLRALNHSDGVRLDYTYAGGLQTSEKWTGLPGTGTTGKVVEVSYDVNYWVESQKVMGAEVTYAYDNDGLITGAGALALQRDTGTGLLAEAKMSSGAGTIITTYEWSAFSELSALETTWGVEPLLSFTYERDALGRITRRTEVGTDEEGERTFDYSYDDAGRLVEVLLGGVLVEEYSYDANGNRTDVTVFHETGIEQSLVKLDITHDAQDRLLSYGDLEFTYTAHGELSSRWNADSEELTTYDYDVFGNLREVELPDGREITYIVDGRNRRVGRILSEDGASDKVESYLYGNQLNVVGLLDGQGALVYRFVYATLGHSPDYVVHVPTNKVYRIVPDHLGSIRRVVEVSTGAVMQRMDYDAYGNVLEDYIDPDWRPLPFGFAGGLYDRETGLVRFGARDYDPFIGRWTAKDPIGFEGGDANLYGYVGGEPIDYLDSTGLVPRGGWLRKAGREVTKEVANTGVGMVADFFLPSSSLIVSGMRRLGGSPWGLGAASLFWDGGLDDPGPPPPIDRHPAPKYCPATYTPEPASEFGSEALLQRLRHTPNGHQLEPIR